MSTLLSHEYVNDFLYFAVRPDINKTKNVLLYCSGVNFHRFLPITKGRHRPMSNCAVRGLQLVNLGVRDLALTNGATPKAVTENDCTEVVPVSEGWYREHLLIGNAPASFYNDMVNYCVLALLKSTFKACVLQVDLPETLPGPDELQVFIEKMCRKYGK